MKRILKALAVSVPMALLAPASGQAHSPVAAEASGELAGLVNEANLIFTGRVTEVRYVNGVDPETKALVPHALVTYRVERVLRGRPPGDLVTVRFIGGPDGQGRFLKVDGVPLFQGGDTDVMFLAGNGESGECPLVRCEYGRFRISRERVYDTHGSPVSAIVKNSTISRGLPPPELRSFSYPTPDFDELIKNPEVRRALEGANLSLDAARARYKEQAPKTMVLTEAFSAPSAEGPRDGGRMGPGRNAAGRPAAAALAARELNLRAPEAAKFTPITTQEFLGVVARLAEQARREPAAFKSIDPNADIRLKPFRAAEPLNIAHRQPPQAGPSDDAERRAFDAAGGNPVIRR